LQVIVTLCGGKTVATAFGKGSAAPMKQSDIVDCSSSSAHYVQNEMSSTPVNRMRRPIIIPEMFQLAPVGTATASVQGKKGPHRVRREG